MCPGCFRCSLSGWSCWGCGDEGSWATSSHASASLLGQGFFPSIQPGFIAVTHTFIFLSQTPGMNYFLLSSRFFCLVLKVSPSPRELCGSLSPSPGSHFLPCSCSPSRGLSGWSVPLGCPFPAPGEGGCSLCLFPCLPISM